MTPLVAEVSAVNVTDPELTFVAITLPLSTML
jgi:hypothetical protein